MEESDELDELASRILYGSTDKLPAEAIAVLVLEAEGLAALYEQDVWKTESTLRRAQADFDNAQERYQDMEARIAQLRQEFVTKRSAK